MIIDRVREKVKQFLREALEFKEVGEGIRVIGIDNLDGGWIAEAEVVERDLTLPGHRVFEKKNYIVKLTDDLEISSYQQVKDQKKKKE